jgi:GTPase SAR1 family protein
MSSTQHTTDKNTPMCVLMIGMAGAGKTALVQRLNAACRVKGQTPYLVNLDPAVLHLPFGANIDIRDTVNYKEVMRQYGLGPNGAIVTSLNLFATRFDQVTSIVKSRSTEGMEASLTSSALSALEATAADTETTTVPVVASKSLKHFIFDTPGQIEVFTWSASGSLITDMLAATLPTVVVFVVDTPRSRSPTTFMANMLYACSILYKTRLPLVIAFNKVDVTPHDFAVEWMGDYDSFQDALDIEGRRSDSYMNSLTRSLGLALDEFYSTLRAVGVSAATGEGVDDLFSALDAAAMEFTETAGAERAAAASALLLANSEREMKDLERLRIDRQDEVRKT